MLFIGRDDLPKRNSILACCALVSALLQPTTGSTKGGTFSLEELYNPAHVTELPPEIRQIVVSKCNEPRATHGFFGYRDGTDDIVLNYEHLLCGLSHSYCARSVCLQEVYSRSANGRYRLIRSLYVRQPQLN
jgi:hypothetical protein